MKKNYGIDVVFYGSIALAIALSFIWFQQLDALDDQAQAELDVAFIEIMERGTIIKQQERVVQELEVTLDDVINKLALLTTFQEAGMKIAPRDIRKLLDLANTLPYGSPFRNGHRITSEFGMRSISRYGWVDQKHLGVDLLPLDGDRTIYMPVDGYITNWGMSETYGNFIEIRTESGYRLYMAHLDHIYFPHVDLDGNWSIDPERIVKKGSRIGIMGSTGTYSTGPHLHYEVWLQLNDGWVPLDPKEIINFIGETEVSDD